ncbi:MAG: hypothetical protein RLZZ80_418 [Pseudomonadota bacterium]
MSLSAHWTPRENSPSLWRASIPRRGPDQNKYDYGHVAVITGELVGAACLAAGAAQRAGAGLVSLLCQPEQWPGLACRAGSQLLWIAHRDRDVLVPLADHRINAVLLGSGWLVSGDGSQQRARITQAMAAQTDGRHWVLDAGALSAFADRADELRALLAPWGGRVVLTPHAGEFERLFGSVVSASDDQVSRTCEAAAFIGAVVVRKGSQTWIASPDGDCWGHDASDMPWLATAGTGDVLAGLTAGLLAQGLTAQQAAGAGCWLQRQAARLAVAQGGGMGLIAEDLLGQLRAAWQSLDQMALRS